MHPDVMRVADIGFSQLASCLKPWGLTAIAVEGHQAIPGSYWGEDEAGLIGERLYLRADTPIHSLLHEACHALCADPKRRAQIHTDAESDDAEENAVCYLQILLADHIPGFNAQRAMTDMDHWGYSFRLGSTQAWFEQDAQDARDWLAQCPHLPASIHGLLQDHH